MFYEVLIRKSFNDFGKYSESAERISANDLWASESDLVSEIYNNLTDGQVYELGIDKLEHCAEDIRGHIENETKRVFAYVYGKNLDQVRYFGIREIEE